MPKVKGKEQLCSCEKKYFKSTQGLGGYSLFDRYYDIENVINKNIHEKYRHFLAQPIVEEDTIIWFTKTYNETPIRLSELDGIGYTKYEQIKNETISHFNKIIDSLKNEGKNSEAESLENAIKFINNDFLYCFDGKVVLGIWGMQLKENVREPLGIAMKNLFIKKKNTKQPDINEPIQNEITEEQNINPNIIRFNSGEEGTLIGNSQLLKHIGESVYESEVPKIEPKSGYEFVGWDKNPVGYNSASDEEFTANYKQIIPPIIPPIISLPWYLRFWNWIKKLLFGNGCLKWLIWLLLLLLILLLIWGLFRRGHSYSNQIPSPINDKPWVHDDPRVGDGGGVYDPGNPYETVPTPPEYSDVLPPNQGVLPPVDTTKIIRNPEKPVIISNILNVLMENEDKSIMDLAKAFKQKYPNDKYKVIYYDDVVKRMQIEAPPEERLKIKSEIPALFAPDYELFVFDESLFEGAYIPDDPAFSDPDKSWYLKTINAPQAWDVTRGSPKLTIAIVDNGFSLNHPELKGKVVMPYNVWLHSNEIFAQEIDHGTHVAGTALAIANNNEGLCGIAPDCAFMPVQVANKQGLMTSTSILDGVLYALYQGADVINISLGLKFTGGIPENVQRDLENNYFKEEERLWNKIMEISKKHNAIIIIAAGNENVLAGISPMNRPKNFVIVSAVDKNSREYQKAGFSNYGDYSTVSAPGVGIYSSFSNNDYRVMDGTSMAAPIVTGTIALMKSLKGDLTAEQIICVLQSTGNNVNGKIGNLIQIDKALQLVKSGEVNNCNNQIETPSTGDVQVLLSWNNYNDLDLICTDPNDDYVWYKNKNVKSGGQLEIDMNVNYPDSKSPIENIFWPTSKAPNGTYNVYLIYSKKHVESKETAYNVTIKYGDKIEKFSGNIKVANDKKLIPICSFTLGNVANQKKSNPPSNNKSKEDLLIERDNLQKRIEQIERDLGSNK
jgi:subtilisin family serine protease